MAERNIGSLASQVPPGGTLTLGPPKCEFEGPLVVRKPLTLIGQGGLLWAKKGPVLRVECSGVVLQDLSVEITGHEEKLTGEGACAIVVAPGLGMTLNDVCVRGNVTGLPEEEGNWRYPRLLRIKVLPNRKQAFHAKFSVPVPCRLVSNVAGVTVDPSHLRAGETDVTITLDSLAPGLRLRGEISLKTAFLIRQIAIIANVSASAGKADGFQVTLWDSLAAGAPAVPAPAVDQDASATVSEPVPTSRPVRKPEKIVRDAAAQLGPSSTPAQKPIPEKLEQAPAPPKAPAPPAPDVLGGRKAPPASSPPIKIKSVPGAALWSQPHEAPAEEAAPPSQPAAATHGPAAAGREAPPQPVSSVPGGDAGASAVPEAGTASPAHSRPRPVLNFSAFNGPPAPAARNREDEDKHAAPESADEVREEAPREADVEPPAPKPEASKPRKLIKADGNLGAFRQQ